MSNQIVLVTGVAGFIGNKVAQFCLEKGNTVIGIDNMNDYYDVSLKEFRVKKLASELGFTFLKGDIEDKIFLEAVFSNNEIDIVYNLAARAGVRYSMENPDIYMSTNAQGSLNILELMRKYKVQKYVLASTSSLYAGLEMPFSEDLDVSTPISPYAATKKAAEAMAYTYHHLYGIDVSIVRYFTVYGPESRPDMAQFRFMKSIDAEVEFELFGDGSQARDFTYVDDIARGTILAGEKKLGYEIMNLGGGQHPVSINYLISELENKLGKKAKLKKLPFHKADMKVTWANIDKAKELLCWEPKISIEEGISKSVISYLENKEFFKKVKI